MITQESIKEAGKKYQMLTSIKSEDIAFQRGANWAIQQMESDMKEFVKWVGQNFICLTDVWVLKYANQVDKDNWITYDELLKKWREGK